LIRNPHQRRRLIANALLASALLACAALLLYPPTQSSLYHACPIREFLGIDCPGCGATRALAALLRGHIVEALRLNALFVVLLPAALAVAAETYRRAIRPGSFRWPSPPAPALYATLAAAAIFTVARNLLS
jgi:hypothetical protein